MTFAMHAQRIIAHLAGGTIPAGALLDEYSQA